MRFLPFLLLLAWALSAAGAQAQPGPGRRVALIIGNGGYSSVERLTNPASDARLMANTLRVAGFELVGGAAQIDLSKAQFDRAVQEFGRALPGAEVALFYYSGHGMQVDGVNWLVPTDANPTRLGDLDFQMLDANLVLRQMQNAGTRLNIVVLDACRNNPFTVGRTRGGTRGLAEMQAPEGTVISYATQPGNVALDGTGGNSPYTTALAEAIHRPGLDVFQVFNQVGLAVKRDTAGQQQPWLASSPIAGSFYFFPGAAPPPASAPAPPPAAGVEMEGMFWQSIVGSQSVGEYEEYLRRFPNGVFAGLARRKIADLQARAAPPAPVATPTPAAPTGPSGESRALAKPESAPAEGTRWTTRSAAECGRQYYIWRTLADTHEFTDQSGQVDVERVLERWAGGMRTETLASRRRGGGGMPPGTRWEYRVQADGSVRVQNLQNNRSFVLTRCPG